MNLLVHISEFGHVEAFHPYRQGPYYKGMNTDNPFRHLIVQIGDCEEKYTELMIQCINAAKAEGLLGVRRDNHVSFEFKNALIVFTDWRVLIYLRKE